MNEILFLVEEVAEGSYTAKTLPGNNFQYLPASVISASASPPASYPSRKRSR
jgi:hypothetical protein